MQTSKSKEKAKINYENNGYVPYNNRRRKNKLNNTIKKASLKTIAIALIVLALGFAIGAGSLFFICRNDQFALLGADEICLTVNEKYYEDGYNVIEFGKNKNNSVSIETDMVINDDGSFSPKLDDNGEPIIATYYIKYTANTFKYSKFSTIERIRLVTFVESSEDNA